MNAGDFWPYFFGFDHAYFPSLSLCGNPADSEYAVGVGMFWKSSVLQPDQFITNVTVAPDGYISFLIWECESEGMNLPQIQQEIQNGWPTVISNPGGDGYLKRPKVKNILFPEKVERPGSYMLEDDMTVLKAISIAGGFTNSAMPTVSNLRQKGNSRGYETIGVNLRRPWTGTK